jgi:mRNA interferase MazF
MIFEKFDIVLVNLDPRKGHAQAGIRPAVVVQSNLFNASSSTVILVPLTAQQKKIFPSEFLINPTQKNGLVGISRFLGSQLMTVDKDFIVKRMGRLEEEYFHQVQEALRISLDWENDFV